MRHELSSELHARPFLAMKPNTHVFYFAAMHMDAASTDLTMEILTNICQDFGFGTPPEDQNVFVTQNDSILFKWERHSEFSAYLFYADTDETEERLASILERHRASVLTSVKLSITNATDGDFKSEIQSRADQFAAESLAVASVLEGAALIACDFQLDTNGHSRFLLIPRKNTGERRIGRIAQRLLELETYKNASLLGLPVARKQMKQLPQFENRLLPIMDSIAHESDAEQNALDELTLLSAQIEGAIAATTFRFSAAAAYGDIVTNRIEILREERVGGFQLFSEFMLRRYEPSMRTIAATWQRLRDVSQRLERAANLLRTRVDVKNTEAQKAILTSMNARAETQLRLQETVEGFSVVAISYYAISLLSYVLVPLAKFLHLEKSTVIALAVLPTMIAVWMFVHRVKKHITSG